MVFRDLARKRVTSDDIDEIIEADASIALIGPLEGYLKFRVLIFGDDVPLFVGELVEVYTTLSIVHSNYYIWESCEAI